MTKTFQPGSMLLQVVIATAIFSTIMMVLGTVFFQLNHSSRSVTRMLSFDTRIFVVQDLLEKDIAGVFLPKLIPLKKEDDKKSGSEAQETLKSGAQDASEKKTKNKKDVYPKQAFFVSLSSSGNLQTMKYITTHPVAVYNTAKPQCIGVEYTLESIAGNGLALYRTEYFNIDADGFKQGQHKFLVIDGIKSLTVVLYAEKKPTDKKDTDKKDAPKEGTDKKGNKENKKRTFEEKKEWNSDDCLKEESEEKYYPLPVFIVFSLTLHDRFQEKEKNVEFVCAPGYGIETVSIDGLKNKEVPQQQQGNSMASVLSKPLSEGLQGKTESFKQKMQK